jgi:hypothetical protein
MTVALTFGKGYIAAVQALVNDLETLRTMADEVAQDPTLFPNYKADPAARVDISAADLTNANNAVGQLLFAFDSGTPAQKSYLFKLF